jgi:hypothetical protein
MTNPEQQWILSVDEFERFARACGPSPLIEEMTAEWRARSWNPAAFPYRQSWEEWLEQFDLYANAKAAGELDWLLESS